MFKKIAIAAVIAIGVSACGQIDRQIASVTGSSESCVDGVAYIQFTSGVTVKYKPDGKIATCGKG